LSRRAKIFYSDQLAGVLLEDDLGYLFTYEEAYLKNPKAVPVSLNLPLRRESFRSKTMFPFFDGLIPEGWLLDIAQKNWKLNPRDRMGLLLACCKDCIGAVSVIDDTDKGITG
jgi:serine/threonine-protein kinase HipA